MKLRSSLAFGALLLACSSTDRITAPTEAPSQPPGADGGGVADAPSEPRDPEVLDLGVVSRSPLSSSEHEPTVAVTRSGRVVVAWIGRGTSAYAIGYRISNDGGKTFGVAKELPLPEGFSAGDPVAAADAQDNLWLAWGIVKRDAGGNRIEGHLFANQSAAGSDAFGPPVEVGDPSASVLYDQPRIVARDGGGLLYTYLEYAKDFSASSIVAATSRDGARFSRQTVHASKSSLGLPFPCEARGGGRLYARFFDSGLGVALHASDDGGATWAVRTRLPEGREVEKVGGETPGCVARGDEVWAMYAIEGEPATGASSFGTLGAIRLAHSADGGKTIDTRVDVHDPTVGKHFMFPEIAMEESGAIDVVYYAGDRPGDPNARLVLSRSIDGGASFKATVVKEPNVLETSRVRASWIGDYTGFAWTAPHLWFAYSDNTQGGAAHTALVRITPH